MRRMHFLFAALTFALASCAPVIAQAAAAAMQAGPGYCIRRRAPDRPRGAAVARATLLGATR